MKSRIVSTLDRVYLFCIWAAGIAITAMSLIIPWGVFTRYVLGTGSQWPEPIAILLMMVFTFIGAAAAYRANSHIAVTMLTDRLPFAGEKLCAWVVDVLMLLACGFVAYYGTKLCIGTMQQSVSELPWLPVGVTYASLPIGAAITILFVLERRFVGSQARRKLMRFEDDSVPAEGAH
jgi:TRAP-type C4-dicarboxylate transport system permease small subunit